MLRDRTDVQLWQTRGRSLPAIAASVLAVLVLSVALWSPAPASAGCGGVQTAKPKRKLNPGGKAPLAIGDSTMLFALPNLAAGGFKVNARGCRQWSEGMALMRQLRRQKRLPHLIAIALGADWIITKRDIRQALHIAGKKRVIALMTPRELGGGTSSDADHIRNAYHKHWKRIVLLDWVRYSRNKGSWFQPDGLHLTFPGARAFSRLMHKSVRWARHGKFPHKNRFPRR